MREKLIEQKLIQAVRRQGGLALKFISPGLNGVPDRLLLFHGGQMAFAEVKAPGLKPRPLQEVRIAQLRALGFRVYVVDGEERIMEMMEDMKNDTGRSGSAVGPVSVTEGLFSGCHEEITIESNEKQSRGEGKK